MYEKVEQEMNDHPEYVGLVFSSVEQQINKNPQQHIELAMRIYESANQLREEVAKPYTVAEGFENPYKLRVEISRTQNGDIGRLVNTATNESHEIRKNMIVGNEKHLVKGIEKGTFDKVVEKLYNAGKAVFGDYGN